MSRSTMPLRILGSIVPSALCALVLAASGSSSPLTAQTEFEQARQAFAQGSSHLADGRYHEARTSFEQAEQALQYAGIPDWFGDEWYGPWEQWWQFLVGFQKAVAGMHLGDTDLTQAGADASYEANELGSGFYDADWDDPVAAEYAELAKRIAYWGGWEPDQPSYRGSGPTVYYDSSKSESEMAHWKEWLVYYSGGFVVPAGALFLPPPRQTRSDPQVWNDSGARAFVLVAWEPTPGAVRYEIQWQASNDEEALQTVRDQDDYPYDEWTQLEWANPDWDNDGNADRYWLTEHLAEEGLEARIEGEAVNMTFGRWRIRAYDANGNMGLFGPWQDWEWHN